LATSLSEVPLYPFSLKQAAAAFSILPRCNWNRVSSAILTICPLFVSPARQSPVAAPEWWLILLSKRAPALVFCARLDYFNLD
jgi:hypothetical protein